MEERRILITYDKAREWFNGDNESLKEIALKAFSERELTHNFRDITTFKKACDELGYNYDDIASKIKSIAEISKASAAMFKLNIIRKVLNLRYDMHISKNVEDENYNDLISIFKGRELCEVIFEKGCFLAFNPKTHMRMPLITGINDYDWELHVVGNKFDKEK